MGERQLKNIARPVRVYRVRDSAVPRPPSPQALPLHDKPSVAVLPFANMSGDPEQEYFADGMVEEIITALSRIRWLFVIARNSSFTYKSQVCGRHSAPAKFGMRPCGGNGKRATPSASSLVAEMRRGLAIERESGSILRLSSLEAAVAKPKRVPAKLMPGSGACQPQAWHFLRLKLSV